MERCSRQSPCHEVVVARLDSFSPEAMEDAVDSGHLEHVQLAPGRFQAQVVRARLGDRCFDWGNYNLPLYARGAMPHDRVTLGLVLSPHADGILNGTGLARPALAVYTEGTELDYRLAAETRWSGFQVTRQDLERLGVNCPRTHSGPVRCDPAHADMLAFSLTQKLDCLVGIVGTAATGSNTRLLVQSVFEGMLAAYATALPSVDHHTAPPAPATHQSLVRRAREYLESRLAEPVRIFELCAETGVSFKTLERAFFRAFGITPQRYLTMARLSRARRLLLAARRDETRVADIAFACGCFHLSRFSRDYRSTFGESPSQTLTQHSGMARKPMIS